MVSTTVGVTILSKRSMFFKRETSVGKEEEFIRGCRLIDTRDSQWQRASRCFLMGQVAKRGGSKEDF